ncbi:hypothetical protein F7725_007950 [Dissostichus mawsoni]|uniref:Uncharacterized protein n=1 Tax=Dissostichus mawsoni TaxID=36200 RepID=A0A7J5Y816_DISMA|nr:hypothetical protein F7725_007950 [Dissostichus mawsoni]
MRGPVRNRQPSWPESDSFTENNPGRQLRRRRKVKRMTSDVTVRLQQKLKVSSVDGKRRQKPSRMQHLAGSKKRSGGWVAADRPTEGARLMGKECWKRKMAKEHRDAADENMSEGETSSTCSSDPGLFTNDEGRQGTQRNPHFNVGWEQFNSMVQSSNCFDLMYLELTDETFMIWEKKNEELSDLDDRYPAPLGGNAGA